MTFIFNLKKDPIDKRDIPFKLKVSTPVKLPEEYDLKKSCPPIISQGNLGACGPNQISQNLKFLLKKQKSVVFQPSRLFIYYFSRVLDNSDIREDTGITLRSGLKSISKFGVCNETEWKYNTTDFTKKPNDQVIEKALFYTKNFKYNSVLQTEQNIKEVIYSGFPVLFGLDIYSSFQSSKALKTGIVPFPNTVKEQKLGGHAMSIIGWNKTHFIVSNTWGKNFGDEGYFYIDYNYILNQDLSNSFWTCSYF